MRIDAYCKTAPPRRLLLTKTLLMTIKLGSIFLVMACLQVSARSFSQKVTLSERNAPLKKVFKDIRKQTGFLFFYSDELLDQAKRVNIQASGLPLEAVLDSCFKDQPLSFHIVDKTIVVDAAPTLPPGSAVAAALAPVTVKGKVTDAQGLPMSGVSITVSGTNRGVMTDEKGNFSMEAEENTVLHISYIGYEAQNISLKGRTSLNIVLRQASSSLNDVVVVGYGTQKKVSVSGAVDQITPAQLEGKPGMNVTQLIQGVSPNLTIQQYDPEPGSTPNFNIRGVHTFGDNSPLVVIDGITAPNGVSDLNMLNPADIESMSVLKDAGVSAIYGSRSANGVLLVTTKKGRKNQAPVLTYSGMWGMQYPKLLFSPLPAWQNAIYKNESLTNVGQAPVYTPEDIQSLQAGGDHEWFLKQILHPAPQQSHNVTLSGGGEHTTFLLSAGYVDQSSNFVGPNFGFTRDNFRVSASSDYGILRASGSIAYTHSELKNNSYDNGFLMADATRTPTNYSMVDSLGRYLTNTVLTQFNPLGILEAGGYSLTDNDEVMGNLNLEVRLPKGFSLKGTVGGNMDYNHGFYRQQQVDFYPAGVYGNTRTTGDNYSQYMFTNINLMANYDRHFGDHEVSAMVGASNESTTAQSSNLYYNYTDSATGLPTSSSVVSTGSNTTNSSPYITALDSYFGRVNYQYMNRYMVEVDFRYDGSSKFAQGLRWGFFPAISGAWRATDEGFLDGVRKNFGNIKFRASYGVLGNQSVSNYQYLTTYSFINGAYGYGNTLVSGTGFAFANQNLQWEKAATLNGGVDVETLKGRLNFSLDYFNKLTKDILVPPAVPGTFGGSLPDYNEGKMRDLGWEFSVKYNFRTGDFVHSIMANLGDSRNEVLSFPGNQQLNGDAELQTVIKPGVPYQAYVGYKREGYFQTVEDVQNSAKLTGITPIPGDIKYKDKNKDGVIDQNDYYVLGNPFPRYTYGLTYNVSWKGIDLSVFIQGVGRRDMFVRGELVDPFQANYSYNIFKHQLDFWSPTNSNAKYPILSANGSPSQTNDYSQPSNIYLFNGAYMRVKNIQVGYTIPASAIHKLGIKKLRVYFTGQNLWTIAGVKFLDPESTEFNSNLSNSNGDNQSGRVYPTPVFYGGGLDLTF